MESFTKCNKNLLDLPKSLPTMRGVFRDPEGGSVRRCAVLDNVIDLFPPTPSPLDAVRAGPRHLFRSEVSEEDLQFIEVFFLESGHGHQ